MSYLFLQAGTVYSTHVIWFWIPFVFLLLITLLFRNQILKDVSTAVKKPYSYARTQLVWWTIIVLSCFMAVYFNTGYIPTFFDSTLILLGISAGTMVTAKVTDNADASNPNVTALSQNSESQGFITDILSDEKGVSIHRFQAVVFNFIIGLWFVQQFLCNLKGFHLCAPCADCGFPHCLTCVLGEFDFDKGKIVQLGINTLMPNVTNNNLILMGLSSGTYAALKATENKKGAPPTNTQGAGAPAPAAAPPVAAPAPAAQAPDAPKAG